MATTSNSNTDGIPIQVVFTEHGAQCIPAAILEAFKTAQWRIVAPTPAANLEGTAVTMRASTLPDNIARVDSEGAIYVPAMLAVEVAEQSVVLTATTAPGTPVDISFSVPGVTDLRTYIDNIYFDIIPPESPVFIGPPRIVGGVYTRSIYRVGDPLATPPFPVVTVRGSGRLIRIPSPSPT